MKPIDVLRKVNATKAQLRKALAEALGVPYVEPAAKQEQEQQYFKPCLNAFLMRYKEVTKLDYNFTAKDGKALKSIIEKIKNITTTGDVTATFTYFIKHLPEWYVKNAFSLTVIDNKFNEIIASIRSSKNVSDGFKQRIVNDLFK